MDLTPFQPICPSPQAATAPEAYVVACLIQGEWQRALMAIEELGPSPAYAPHLAAAGGRLLAERQWEQAARLAEAAICMDEGCAAAHRLLGEALERQLLRQSDPSLELRMEGALRRAVELDADELPARVALALLCLKQDRLVDARSLIERALELDPSDGAARDALKRLRKAVESENKTTGKMPAADPSGASEAEDLRRLAARAHQRAAEQSRAHGERPTLSLCLVTRDEAKNLPRVIESVRGLATEVIVVDTGSTDDTLRVARRLKARVESIPWEDDFAAARNHSLQLATGDWILVLDADDELLRESVPALAAWLRQSPAADVVGLYRRYPHPEMQRDSVSVQPRLFRNRRSLRFVGAIHEQLADEHGQPAQPDVTLTATIYHHGAIDGPGATQRRRVRNRRILERVLEADPEDTRARFYLGLTLYEGEAWREAAPHLEAVVRRNEAGCDFAPKAYACLANALLNDHRPFDAETVLQEGLHRFPHHPELWFCRGLLLDSLGRLEEAVEAHEAALRGRFGPSLNWHDWACREAKPHLALCDLRLSLGAPEAAERHLAAAEGFNGPQPYHEQIRLAIRQTQAEQARLLEEQKRQLTTLLTQLDAGDPAAGLEAVTMLLDAGRHEEAAELVERWGTADHQAEERSLAGGLVALAMGLATQALRVFRAVRKHRLDCLQAWCGEADACCALGQIDEAAQALREAGSLALETPQATQALGERYLRLEQWEEARRWLQRSLEQRDDDWTAWLSLGRASMQLGNLPVALNCYQRAATLSGGNAAVRIALGEARAHLARSRTTVATSMGSEPRVVPSLTSIQAR
jgi:tetratricopeptide (TPR) repeat protein